VVHALPCGLVNTGIILPASRSSIFAGKTTAEHMRKPARETQNQNHLRREQETFSLAGVDQYAKNNTAFPSVISVSFPGPPCSQNLRI
jgi:hypothetical protein